MSRVAFGFFLFGLGGGGVGYVFFLLSVLCSISVALVVWWFALGGLIMRDDVNPV